LTACRLVDVKVLGSQANVPVQVLVGMSRADQEALLELDRSIASLRRTREKVAHNVSAFERLSPNLDRLSDFERQLYCRLKKASVLIAYQLRQCAQDRQNRVERQCLDSQGLVRITEQLMAGVSFRMGDKVLRAAKNRGPCVVRYDKKQGDLRCLAYH